jgi:hypothetical protein
MKTALSTLAAGFALAFGAAAFAGPAGDAPAVTQWDQRQEHLVREFSQGLGVDIAGVQPALLARADSASVGPTADVRARKHGDRQRERSHPHRTKAAKHSN